MIPPEPSKPMRVVRPFCSVLDASERSVGTRGPSAGTKDATLLFELGLHLCTSWAKNPLLRSAPLAALDASPTLDTVAALWTLMELGIPILPLHPAWPRAHRERVIAATKALDLGEARAAPADLDGGRAFEVLRRPVDEASTLAVIYTSGTSGEPKGAKLSHRAFWTSTRAASEVFGESAFGRWYLSLPLAHVGGFSILTRAAVLASSVALPEEGGATAHPGFRAAAFVADCSAKGATGVSLVPTQLQRIVASGLRAPPDLQMVLLGGAPAPQSLITAALSLGWPVHRSYGLTEACAQVATDRTPCSVGRIPLLPHVDAKLESESRLALRGDSLFSGYWGESSRRPDEWFVTSDVAEVEDDGLKVLGRADDVVISGGEKIHPVELDATLASAPGIAAACAFGRYSEMWGEQLCAALVRGADFDAEVFSSYLRRQLPSYKVPKAWVFVSELPTTASGKVSRSVCRQRYADVCHPWPSPDPL